MVENLTVIDLNGNSIVVEGISFIRLSTNNKTYAFYTLNEVADNGLIKIYIAEANETNGVSMPIDDQTYDIIKKAMIKITGGSMAPEFNYLPMQGKTFYVGLQKKMVIKPEKMQMLKNSYATSLQNQVAQPQNENIQTAQNVNNLETPIVPEVENLEQTQNAFDASPIMPENPSEELATSTGGEQVIESMETVNQVQEPIQDKQDDVTYEEAVEALNVLNRYFQKTKVLPSDIRDDLMNTQVSNNLNVNQIDQSLDMNVFDNINPVDSNIDLGVQSTIQPVNNIAEQNFDTLAEASVAQDPISDINNPQTMPSENIAFNMGASKDLVTPGESLINMNDLNTLDSIPESQMYVNNVQPAQAEIQNAEVVMPDGYNQGVVQDSGMVTPNTIVNNQEVSAFPDQMTV